MNADDVKTFESQGYLVIPDCLLEEQLSELETVRTLCSCRFVCYCT